MRDGPVKPLNAAECRSIVSATRLRIDVARSIVSEAHWRHGIFMDLNGEPARVKARPALGVLARLVFEMLQHRGRRVLELRPEDARTFPNAIHELGLWRWWIGGSMDREGDVVFYGPVSSRLDAAGAETAAEEIAAGLCGETGPKGWIDTSGYDPSRWTPRA